MKNYEKIVAYQVNRSDQKYKNVITAVKKLKKSKHALTIQNIANEANVSRQYIYGNEKLMEIINTAKETSVIRTPVKTLRYQIDILTKENEILRNRIEKKEKELEQQKKHATIIENELKKLRDENKKLAQIIYEQ